MTLTSSRRKGWTADAKHLHPPAIKSDLLQLLSSDDWVTGSVVLSVQSFKWNQCSVKGTVDSFTSNVIKGVSSLDCCFGETGGFFFYACQVSINVTSILVEQGKC